MNETTLKIVDLIKLKQLEFMDDQGTEGFTLQWFKEAYADEVRDMVIEDVLEGTGEIVTDVVINRAWSENKRDGRADHAADFQQMSFGGIPCSQFITFYDDSVPGNHRSVSYKYATVYQYQLSRELKQEKAHQVQASVDQCDLQIGTMVSRCRARGLDPAQTPIWMVQDDDLADQ